MYFETPSSPQTFSQWALSKNIHRFYYKFKANSLISLKSQFFSWTETTLWLINFQTFAIAKVCSMEWNRYAFDSDSLQKWKFRFVTQEPRSGDCFGKGVRDPGISGQQCPRAPTFFFWLRVITGSPILKNWFWVGASSSSLWHLPSRAALHCLAQFGSFVKSYNNKWANGSGRNWL